MRERTFKGNGGGGGAASPTARPLDLNPLDLLLSFPENFCSPPFHPLNNHNTFVPPIFVPLATRQHNNNTHELEKNNNASM